MKPKHLRKTNKLNSKYDKITLKKAYEVINIVHFDSYENAFKLFQTYSLYVS